MDSKSGAALPPLANGAFGAGDPMPWIRVRMEPGGAVNLEQFGGLVTALVFLGAASDPRAAAILARLASALAALRAEVPANRFAIVPVFAEAAALDHASVKAWQRAAPVMIDADLALHRALGLVTGNKVRIMGFVTDPQLILRATVEFADPDAFAASVAASVRAQHSANRPTRAPLLVLPGVFAPDECAMLIAHYRASTPEGSGYVLKAPDGKYQHIDDPNRKVRSDVILAAESELFAAVMERLRRRVFVPMRRCFMFETVALERILLARYGADTGGHFRKHRDFGDQASHREFGLTVNLNEDFQGGTLAFPEFPGEIHKPPPGAALVYSGALTHQVEPVTAGERFCLLSFMMGARGMASVERYRAEHGEAIAAHPVPDGPPDSFAR
jgi:predicted 2-oxoglutarate/Fe(II)-dependent dioxygenase YbiX